LGGGGDPIVAPSESVQTRNVNSSSLSDVFKLVATGFQQIVTELNGAKSEGDRTLAITKLYHEAKWALDFIGSGYDCGDQTSSNCKR
jgi:hypothetical protein